MRVLHLSAGNLYGGVERLLFTLASERGACADMQPHFGLCFEGRVANELRSQAAPVHIMGNVRFRHPWTVWRARRRLANVLRQEQFGASDFVICHSAWPYALFAPVVRASCPARLAFWLHDPPAQKLSWSERLSCRTRPDVVLCNSAYTAATGAALFAGVVRQVLYCPVAPPKRIPDAT